ncbi:hypothetical protein ASC75_04445 [Aminobacter sp. DSM 101952]|uniref:hypothetical protein n=1 Tax=Aminobacter sp. DSM 101952 TaxID=2735891 RepID=UPI0006F6C681|nr:hypothetical protein [Aminobacter sp. DSM 101952]KQU72922.1 hypothetical protein ASC75_04445 [Aminobacter sp. DSM 101952]
MAAPDELLDTNILVYAFTTDPRCATAEKLLAKGCLVSVQGLNEFGQRNGAVAVGGRDGHRGTLVA